VTYEAAAAFDPALVTRQPGQLPLAWFGLFRSIIRHESLPLRRAGRPARVAWRPSIDITEYRRAVERIRSAIARGETYQANFSFRLRASFSGSASGFFVQLVEAQPVGHAAFIDIGRHAICSGSPELFFRLENGDVVCRPMKGTSKRGLTSSVDRLRALELYNSPKNRAENLMIVDMIRNDLGRIADPGSVSVSSLFDLERYESVHQLTSEVRARTSRSAVEVLSALFPCASITGAPKIATMRLLADLETAPRGIYTGTLGYFAPDGRATFNVAIRTVHVDRQEQTAEFGTGGGIVWDSEAAAEHQECSAKASVLLLERPPFQLLETFRVDPDGKVFLLSRHLDRLADSADYFGFVFDRKAAEEALTRIDPSGTVQPHRYRLLLSRNGELEIVSAGSAKTDRRPWRVALSAHPVPRDDVFLHHKTTVRKIYALARAAAPGHDDVLLWNESQRVTESTIANLVVEIRGRRRTPPVEDGLLAGTFREELLDRHEIEICPVMIEDLANADAVWLVNSVREWIAVESIDDQRAGAASSLWRNTRI
jgi:para-aminobenzoate synthetase/4-amino-4-deoxychorismate lyase